MTGDPHFKIMQQFQPLRTQNMTFRRLQLAFVWGIALMVCAAAQAPAPDVSRLTLDRIFDSSDFDPKGIGGLRWLKSGDAYSKIEPSPTLKGGTDLVSYDVATNKRTVLVAAEK